MPNITLDKLEAFVTDLIASRARGATARIQVPPPTSTPNLLLHPPPPNPLLVAGWLFQRIVTHLCKYRVFEGNNMGVRHCPTSSIRIGSDEFLPSFPLPGPTTTCRRLYPRQGTRRKRSANGLLEKARGNLPPPLATSPGQGSRQGAPGLRSIGHRHRTATTALMYRERSEEVAIVSCRHCTVFPERVCRYMSDSAFL